MLIKTLKNLFPSKLKRRIKEQLGVPSLHWSLQNLKRKNYVPQVILDIGAYEGLWALDVLEVFPSSKILMIEAQKSKEPFLKAIKSRHSNIDYEICLLSSENAGVKYFAENETASHIVKNADSLENFRSIETESLDALLERRKYPLPDMLKLDVQGHEKEVLKGAEKSLKHAMICLLEISLLDLGDDMPLLKEMVSFMDEKGYQPYDISHFIRRPFDKALYQIDMFFVKKNSYLIAEKPGEKNSFHYNRTTVYQSTNR